MKKILAFVLAITIAFLVQSFFLFEENPATTKIKRFWNKELADFKLEFIKLKAEFEKDGKVSENRFKSLRKKYKRSETLIAYYFPNHEKALNGAPLNSVYTDVIVADVEPPTGMQLIEEMLFAEDEINIEETNEEITFATEVTHQLVLDASSFYIDDRSVFEACRQEILRISTLGLSGFDSPVFGNTLPEVKVALNGTFEILSNYFDYANSLKSSQPKLLEELFKDADEYLTRNTDFESFNRAFFIKEFLDPIFASILQLHLDCQIETIDLVSPNPQKVNYFAKSLFASDLLDPYAYNKVGREKENEKLAAIGKLMFFDPMLSSNNKRACASCHNPKIAFTDGLKTSYNFDKSGFIKRNAPTIINASTQDAFFWDGRSENLNDQVDHVALNKDEFRTSFGDILIKLRENKNYISLFEEAYKRQIKPSELGIGDIKTALSQYMKTLVSYNSPFDKYMRGEIAEIDQSIIDGFNTFMGKAACGTCHFPPTFYGLVPPKFEDSEFEVLGVANTSENKVWDDDLGRFDIFPRVNHYRGSFKTPTIRNIALTAPYMHNGEYSTLEDVVNFYNNGGGVGHGFNIPWQTLPSDSLFLTEYEKSTLIKFMEALTDTTGMTSIPKSLPEFEEVTLNNRKVGGEY